MDTNSGFTLLEAMVTITVLGILSTLILSGVVTARRNSAVRRAADQFAGHLREAESLAQSGVKDSACLSAAGADLVQRKECSKYRVSFAGGGETYTRDTVLGSTSYGAVVFTLPPGVKFQGTDTTTMTFTYTPPIITVVNATEVTLVHAGSASAQSFVCVSPPGVIEVRHAGC